MATLTIETSDRALFEELKSTAPSGITIDPILITPLGVGTETCMALIAIGCSCTGKFVADVFKPVVTAWLMEAFKKRGYLGSQDEKPKKITIKRRVIECTEANIKRIVEEHFVEEQ